MVGFGALAGTGFGLGYAAATPAAVKWFPPEKKGLITGLVVAGFGVAPVYISPLAKWLLASQGDRLVVPHPRPSPSRWRCWSWPSSSGTRAAARRPGRAPPAAPRTPTGAR